MNQKKLLRHQMILPGAEIGAKVTRDKLNRSNFNYAIKSWKRQLKDSGKLQVMKDRTQFEKPAVTRRLAKKRRKYIAQQETLKRI
jgi:ribosomal protein S21